MGKGVKTRKPGDPRFPVLHDIYPKAFMFVGGFLLIAVLISLPSAIRIYERDSDLRANGTTARAVVERVDSVRHSSRRSTWYEYIPVVKFQINGQSQTSTLRDYSSKSTNEFAVGEKLTIMYDSSKPYSDPGIRDEQARSHIVRNLIQNSILAVLGIGLFLIGTPVVILRAARKRTEKRRLKADKSSTV